MKPYQVYRALAFICLVIILVISWQYYSDSISEKLFAVANGVLAIMAAVFSIFAGKPIDKEDVSVAIDKVLLTYDAKAIESLKQVKEEEQRIKDYIEHRSTEYFLVKVREYLVQQIEVKYRNSELSKLITDLEQIELQLDNMNVQYASIELPERFKKILNELNEREKFELYLDLLDSIPVPFFFKWTKQMYSAVMRIAFRYRSEIKKLVNKLIEKSSNENSN